MEGESDYTVSFLGPANAGKTSIINFLCDTKFDGGTTIGISYTFYCYGNKTVCLWDNPGQVRYRKINLIMNKRFKSFIFVFDLSNLASFQQIQQIRKEFDEMAPLQKKICVIGNKSDLKRAIDKDFIQNYWKQKGIHYVELNIINDAEARKKIQSVLALFSLQHQNDTQKQNVIKLQKEINKPIKKKCC